MSEQPVTPTSNVQRAISALIAPGSETQEITPSPGHPGDVTTNSDAPSQEGGAHPGATPATPPAEDVTLAQLIRQQREERAARQTREKEAGDLRARVAELEAQLSKNAKADLLGDPVGYAEANGLTRDEIALLGQSLLYHLVPEKAPPDLRSRLLEAKLARKDRATEAQRAKDAEAAKAQASQEQIRQYAQMVKATAQSWGEADFPASQAWFGGNHDEYTTSLLHTANNLAEAAQSRGQVADLSPKAVAAVLERDIAARAARFKPAAAAPASSSAGEPPPGGKQPAVLSTKGQGGSPLPKATTERERVERAIAVAFNDR